MCEFSEADTFQLIYKATADGFTANDFHTKCGSIKNTLTIVKTCANYVFGGYTSQDWSAVSGREPNTLIKDAKADENAFIFSLYNYENNPLKLKCVNPQRAISCNINYGPIFGFGLADFVIFDSSNTNKSSYSYLSNCYKHPTYPKGSLKAKRFLSGNFHFKAVEIEIYARNNS